MKDFANLKKYALDNLEITFNSRGSIVFMGDSITEFWKTLNADYFTINSFINRGISGQTTSQMLLRFQQDVINLKPSTVVILAGINDIAENTGLILTVDIIKNITSMVDIAKKNNIKVILCSVLPANKFSWRSDLKPAEKVIELNSYIKLYCIENKISYVDFYNKMVDENKGLISKFGADGVHPNLLGYQTMESILDEELVQSSN